MAKNKTSKIDLNDGLFGAHRESRPREDSRHKNTVPAGQTHVADLAQVFNPAGESFDRPLGSTQGKKGQHAKRINMAFSDGNHSYITRESRRRGLSKTQFVNMIIEKYAASSEGNIRFD